MDMVVSILRQIAHAFRPDSLIGLLTNNAQVFLLIIIGYLLHYLPVKIKESYRGLFISLPLLVKILIIYIIALLLYNVQSADMQPFIYFRF